MRSQQPLCVHLGPWREHVSLGRTRRALGVRTPGLGREHAGPWARTRRALGVYTRGPGRVHAGPWACTRRALAMYTPGLGCVHIGPCARRAIGSDTHRGSLQFAVGCVVRFSWSAWIVVKVVDGCWAVPYIVWSCARRIPLPHGGAFVGSLCIPSPLAASALACWRIGAGVLACVCVLLCCLSCELPRDSLVVRFCKPCHVERRREDGAAHPAGIRRKGLCMWLADRGTPKVCDSFRRSRPPSLRAPVEGG